jgi:hypothetical protein
MGVITPHSLVYHSGEDLRVTSLVWAGQVFDFPCANRLEIGKTLAPHIVIAACGSGAEISGEGVGA